MGILSFSIIKRTFNTLSSERDVLIGSTLRFRATITPEGMSIAKMSSKKIIFFPSFNSLPPDELFPPAI